MTLLDCLTVEDGMFTTENLDARRQRLWQLQELVFEFNIDYELGRELEYIQSNLIYLNDINPVTDIPLLQDILVDTYFEKSHITASLRNKTLGLKKIC